MQLGTGGAGRPTGGLNLPLGPNQGIVGRAAPIQHPQPQPIPPQSMPSRQRASLQQHSSAQIQAITLEQQQQQQQQQRQPQPQQIPGSANMEAGFSAQGAKHAMPGVGLAARVRGDVIQISSGSDEEAERGLLEDSSDGSQGQGNVPTKRARLSEAADVDSPVQRPVGGRRRVVLDTEDDSDEAQDPELGGPDSRLPAETKPGAANGSQHQHERSAHDKDTNGDEPGLLDLGDTEIPESPPSAAGAGEWPDEPREVGHGSDNEVSGVREGQPVSPPEELQTLLLKELAQQASAPDRGGKPLLARILHGSVKTLRGSMKFRNEADNSPLER